MYRILMTLIISWIYIYIKIHTKTKMHSKTLYKRLK